MRRIVIALTGLLAALGLAFIATPANADVTPLTANETGAWSGTLMQDNNQNSVGSEDTTHNLGIGQCQALTLPVDANNPANRIPAKSLMNRSGNQTVQYFAASPVGVPNCTVLVATLSPGAADPGEAAGTPNTLGTNGATHFQRIS